ncbi:MAG: hypothetical protein AAGK09_04810 [Planctomycetota bacterium]
MGTTILQAGEKVEVFKDWTVWTIVRFARFEASQAGLMRAERLFDDVTWPGPGVIVGVEQVQAAMSQDHTAPQLLKALDLVEARCRDAGIEVPKEFFNVNEIASTPLNPWTRNLDVDRFFQSLKRFREILIASAETDVY